MFKNLVITFIGIALFSFNAKGLDGHISKKAMKANAASQNRNIQGGQEGLKFEGAIYDLGRTVIGSEIITGDFNGDSYKEIVARSISQDSTYSKLSFIDVVDGRYHVRDQIRLRSDISSMSHVYEVKADNHYAMLGTTDGSLIVVNLVSRKVETEITLSSSSIQSIVFQNVINDGDKELLVHSGSDLFVLSTNTYEVISHFSVGEGDMVFGSFTEQDQKELAFSSGQIFRFEGNELSLEKEFGLFIGYLLRAYDVDGDDIDEIIGAQYGSSLSMYSALTLSKGWTHANYGNIHSLDLNDVNSDGILDVVYSHQKTRMVYALDMETGEEIWRIRSDYYGISSVLATDIDGDGSDEIMWWNGTYDNNGDQFSVYNLVSSELEWSSSYLELPAKVYDIADTNSNGNLDLNWVTNNDGIGNKQSQIYSVELSLESMKSDYFNNVSTIIELGEYAPDASITKVEHSNEKKVIYPDYWGKLTLANLDDVENQRSIDFSELGRVVSWAVGDVDGDGDEDLVSANILEFFDLGTTTFSVTDFLNSEVKSTSSIVNPNFEYINEILLLNLHQEQFKDVYARSSDKIYRYNAVENSVSVIAEGYEFLTFSEATVDGSVLLYLGDKSGWLHSINSQGSIYKLVRLCESELSHLASLPNEKTAFTCKDKFGVLDNDSLLVDWEQELLGVEGKVKQIELNNIRYYVATGEDIHIFSEKNSNTDTSLLDHSVNTFANSEIELSLLNAGTDLKRYFLTSQPQHGVVEFSDRSTGAFKYTPNGNYLGVDKFQYSAVLNGELVKPATVTIELTNAIPVAKEVTVETHWDSEIEIQLEGIDDDGEQLNYNLRSEVSAGELTWKDETTGKLTYKTSGESLEPVSFTYSVNDAFAYSAVSTVTIELTNSTPVAKATTVETHWDSEIEIQLEGFDNDGDQLNFNLLSEVSSGELTWKDEATGTLTYKTSGESLEPVFFTYSVNDTFAYSAVSTVTIELTNSTPVADNLSFSTNFDKKLNGQLVAVDADRDELTYEVVRNPAAGKLELNETDGSFIYIPEGKSHQVIDFEYKVKDKLSESEVQIVTIVVSVEKQSELSEKSSGGSVGTVFILMLLTMIRKCSLIRLNCRFRS